MTLKEQAKNELKLWYDGDHDPAHIEQAEYFYDEALKAEHKEKEVWKRRCEAAENVSKGQNLGSESVEFLEWQSIVKSMEAGEMRDYKDYYRQGFEDGARCFAWWKDGWQYVGMSGMLLSEALDQVEKLYGFNYPVPEDKII